MVCDSQTSNCSQRAHYGEGPDDWEWVRWYFAQDDALDLPFEEAFGFSVWETDVDRSASEIGTPLTPSCYMGAEENVHPGTHWFGPVQYFQDGVPAAAFVGPDAFPMCDGEGWASVAPIPVGVPTEPEPVLLELEGGVDLGAHFTMGGVCWIPYGGCVHLNGGVEFGGSLGYSTSGGIELRGGIDLGGSLSLGGSGLVLRGGVSFGSTIPSWSSAGIDLRGGVEFGGGPLAAGGSGLTLAGGVEFGGFFPTVTGSGIVVDGGVDLGGALTMEGGADCGPVPTLVGARIRPHRLSEDEIAFPAGTVAGDLVMVFVFEASSPHIAGFPLGWTLLGAVGPFAWPVSVAAYWKRWDGSGSAGVHVTGVIGKQFQLACVTVRNTSDPVSGGTDSDTTDVQQLPAYVVDPCPSLLIAAAACADYDNDYNTFTGVTNVFPDPEQTPMWLWKLDPAGPGSVGGGLVTPDVPATWVSLLVIFPPA